MIIPEGEMPTDKDAVGFQTHVPKYGKHFLGITLTNIGKVKDGLMYYGAFGQEYMTKNFNYIKVISIGPEEPFEDGMADRNFASQLS